MARNCSVSTDGINLGSHAVFQPAAITLSIWIKPSSAVQASYANIFELENTANTGSMYFIGSSGTGPHLSYFFSSSGATLDPGIASMSAGVWMHVAATYDNAGGGLKPFVNGVSEGTTAASGALVTSTNSTTIGFDRNGAFAFAGSLADAAIWNLALTSAEIVALSKGARPYMVRAKSLVGWWPLDGLQSPEPDLSGNANNGTVTGTTKSSGPPFAPFTRRWPQGIPLSYTPFAQICM